MYVVWCRCHPRSCSYCIITIYFASAFLLSPGTFFHQTCLFPMNCAIPYGAS